MHHQNLHQLKKHILLLEPPHLLLNQNHILHLLLQETYLLLNILILFLIPLDAPLRPSHPLPIQSHLSLGITLSLSPNTPLDNMFETPSPPSPLACVTDISKMDKNEAKKDKTEHGIGRAWENEAKDVFHL
ncbi:hypothetical protein Tco_1119190 [Tanacetum coccineum]